jgi:hypothetical protein
MPANYVLLEKITVGAAGAANVTFSNIPQTGYTDLVIKTSTRDVGARKRSSLVLNFNGSSANLTYRRIYGVVAFGSVGSDNGTDGATGYTNGNTSTANTFGNDEIYIPNYTSANYKSYSADGVAESNDNDAGIALTANLWSSTAAITSITVTTTVPDAFLQYSTFYLYGVAKLGTTPAIVPYATGGDTIETDGTYWYHAFLSSGTFTPAKGLSCDVLVVAGGGGGAGVVGGGGGAGGYQLFSTQSISTARTVTIGGGGVGGSGGGGNTGLTSGSNSQFGSLTASVGGGYGGTIGAALAGATGGSGGGGSGALAVGSATSGQGFAGGSGTPNAGGGGGGSGAVGGASPTATVGGPGGAGKNSESSWLSVTGLGVSGFIAGGGGGGGNAGGAGGAAGSGGASAGTQSTNALPATANTGSGGGGGYSGGNGGAGGSGLVIVRYAV